MTGTQPPLSRDAVRRPRRFLALVRGVFAALSAPALAIAAPMVRLVARPRTRGFVRLALGSQAEHAPRVPARSAPAAPISAPSMTAPSGSAPARARTAVRRDGLFSLVRVAPEFSPRSYARTFAALQSEPSAKLLDLTPARLFSADLFDQLAGAWTASGDSVPRLGIVVSFERWVMLRETAVAALLPLADRGVRVEVFYEEQAWGGKINAWFLHGQLVHNVAPAIATLAMRWQPSAIWPMVIDTLARLVRAHTGTADMPALLTEVAGLALSCGGAEQAETLAREALYYLPEVPSRTRSKALRELGAALMGRGLTEIGLATLDQAIVMAAAAHDAATGASALCQSGMFALNHGDDASAERRFREAIGLLSPPIRRPQLLALAHHSLAIALMHQGKGDAEHHAQTALALRPDPHSHLAEQDRLLLSTLREVRAELN